MANWLNPIQDLSVNPRNFIKQKVDSAKNDLVGLPTNQSNAPIVNASKKLMKSQVTPNQISTPEISTPSLENVSANLPKAPQSTLQQNNEKVIEESKPTQMGKFFNNITLDQETKLRERLRQNMPNSSAEERLAKAKEIVAQFTAPKPQKNVSPLWAIKDIGKEWRKEVKNVWEEQKKDSTAYNNWEIGADSHLIQTVGNVSNALLGAPIKAVMNSFINKVLPEETKQKWGEAIADFMKNTSAGQAISTTLDQYQQFAEKHPEAADDMQAILDTALNLVGGKAWTFLVKEWAEQAGKTIIKEWLEQGTKMVEKRAVSAAKKTDDAIWNAISPEMTKAEREARIWLSTKKGVTGKTTYAPMEAEKTLIQTAKEAWIKDSADAVTNYKKAQDALTKAADELETVVKDNPVTFTTKEINKRMNDIEIPPLVKADSTMNNMYKLAQERFMQLLEKQPKMNAEWLLKARKEFDAWVKKSYPNLYEGNYTPLRAAIQDVRNIPNTLINERIGWDIVKNSLQKQTDLYKIMENISSRAEKPWTSFFDRNPRLKKAWKRTLGTVWWAYGLKMLWDIID